MGSTMCPGQDTRFWRPGDIFDVTCAKCGAVTEFFRDEAKRKCPKCKSIIKNPKLSLGCAQWCEHAKECLGYDPKEHQDDMEQETALVDILINSMKKIFGDDEKRIEHSFSVLHHAKEILKAEDADPKVVMAAAILHDIGIKEAEKKHGSSAGVYQEKEGPAIAEPIMKEAGMDDDSIEHVLKIIASHHSAKDIDTPEFRVIWDADWMVNIPDEYPDLAKDEMEAKIEKIFKTKTGKEMANEKYLSAS